MIDKDGMPMLFFHGNKNEFDIFDKKYIGTANDAGWLGEGFYFYGDITQAQQYGKVSIYILKIVNPYNPNYKDLRKLSEVNSKRLSQKYTTFVKSKGYDGIYFNGDLRGESVVYESDQIFKISNTVFQNVQ